MRYHDLTGTDHRPANGAYLLLVNDLLAAPVIHTGEWQAMDTTASKHHGTHELEDISLIFDPLPDDLDMVIPYIDQSWADDHFLERVSGHPMNPAPSHLRWPYAVGGNGRHMVQEKFDHTYPERFWPKRANVSCPSPEECMGNHDHPGHYDRRGIHFEYGDLNDLVDLLVRSPLTRQAYLPVWFPEDTGATQGQRVPCTLGYHFMIRNGKLSCRYYMRSCDVYRHLSNDVYLAAMLTKWICKEVNQRRQELFTPDGVTPLLEYTGDRAIRPGHLVMHISSLHAFVGDEKAIKQRLADLP